MTLSRESILDKTHYGLNIYSYVLRQYYKGKTVLSLSGRDCKPTCNPFNEDKLTLLIKIVDGCAQHKDLEEAIEPGDVFDFASMHFDLAGQELNEKLNDVLHLRIGKEQGFYLHSKPQLKIDAVESVKPKPPICSYFSKPVSNIYPTKKVSLIDLYYLIIGDDFAQCTNELRKIKDVKEARKYKAVNFDYATFSGEFSKRNDKNLKKHSGLLTIDFDHISNLSEIKDALIEDQYFETELMFVSPSGDGLKWIIPIDLTKANHKDYFKAVANYIKYTYALEVDQSGKDISRACFLPHDPLAFLNPKYM